MAIPSGLHATDRSRTIPMNPTHFKFLDSYTPQDIGSFFGRERETGELFRQCFVSPILVVYGGSGTGKTSLVQLSLIHISEPTRPY